MVRKTFTNISRAPIAMPYVDRILDDMVMSQRKPHTEPSTNLPVVENRQTECLAKSVCPKIRLKTKRVNGWQVGFNSVERRARNRNVLSHMTSRVQPYRYCIDYRTSFIDV